MRLTLAMVFMVVMMALAQTGSIFAFGDIDGNVPSGENFVSVSAGYSHCLSMKDTGVIKTWGNGATPRAGTFSCMDAANDYDCAANADTLLFYGEWTTPPSSIPSHQYQQVAVGGTSGFVGLDEYGIIRDTFENTPSGEDYEQVSMGDEWAVALKNEILYTWGFRPEGIPESATGYLFVSAGPDYLLAVTLDGEVEAWGEVSHGQCSPGVLTNIVKVSAGKYDCLALDADGQVFHWGQGGYGIANVEDLYEDQHRAIDISAGFNFVAVIAYYDEAMGIEDNTAGISPLILSANPCFGAQFASFEPSTTARTLTVYNISGRVVNSVEVTAGEKSAQWTENEEPGMRFAVLGNSSATYAITR